MDIYAKGKNISTYPFSSLFVQGEKLADTITFYVDRFYEGNDIYGCSFLIRGVNESGEEAQQALLPELHGEDKLALVWCVSEYFTAAAGKLELELRAVSENTDGEEQIVLKYIMQPVNVAASPNGENTPLPDTADQLLNEIAAAVDSGLNEIELLVDSFNISEVERRLDSMEEKTEIYAARPEVIPITLTEYNSIEHKQDALYVIVKE